MKAQYKCRKCGLEANSKCIKQRSLFTHAPADLDTEEKLPDTKATIMSNLCGVCSKFNRERGCWEVSISSKDIYMRDDNSSYEEAEKELVKLIQNMGPKATEYWLCDHEFEVNHECNFGCCKIGDIIRW